MQQPPYIKKGARIAITCPAGYIAKETVLQSKKVLEKWGYEVVLGKTVGDGFNYFSAPDEVRLQDLQLFLDDTRIDVILMGRGGYGLSRIIDGLDFTTFIQRPKWICGFSDITVLHSHINSNYGIATLHGPMCSSFTDKNAKLPFLQSFKNILTGRKTQYTLPQNDYNIPGTATGVLVGGNLAMLAHLTGSASQINTRDKILFIEDIGEHLYNIDRLMVNLKRAGTFNRLKALLCGGFTDLEDTTRPFGSNIYEIILHHAADLNIPVCFDLPCGHIDENYSLCLGGQYEISVSDKGFSALNQL